MAVEYGICRGCPDGNSSGCVFSRHEIGHPWRFVGTTRGYWETYCFFGFGVLYAGDEAVFMERYRLGSWVADIKPVSEEEVLQYLL